jgi:hypothetical protein
MKTTKRMTFNIIFYLLLAVPAGAQNIAPGNFIELIRKFEKGNTSLSHAELNKYFGISISDENPYPEGMSNIKADKLVVVAEKFLCVSVSYSHIAGAGSDVKKLYAFDPAGNLIDSFDMYEFESADEDCSYSAKCTYSSNILFIKYETDCSHEGKSIKTRMISFSGNGKISASDYRIIDIGRDYYMASTELLPVPMLLKMGKNELATMRNEIYAAHGFIFKTDKWKKHFENKLWYEPIHDNIDQLLSPLEKANIELIKKYEK